ncbi:zinc-binding dehydrogenase [Streptomyces longispororuber]|nr:zinc-binding dehydrogenase [Streptomyces longispororuber]
MSVPWHGAGRSSSGPGDVVLVAGAGPVGIGAWYAFPRGGEHIVVSEPNAERRGKIAALGAHVVDPVGEDLEALVSGLGGGDGVDVFCDAAGAGAALRSALANLAPGGRVMDSAARGVTPVKHGGRTAGSPRAPLSLRVLVLGRGGVVVPAMSAATSAQTPHGPRPCGTVRHVPA